jgi:hypothetical protein
VFLVEILGILAAFGGVNNGSLLMKVFSASVIDCASIFESLERLGSRKENVVERSQ